MRTTRNLPSLLLAIAALFASPGILHAADVVRASGVEGGVIVLIGSADVDQIASLRLNDRYLIHALDTDATRIDQLRRQLIADGLYGPISVDRFDGRRLPYVDNFVNLLVVEQPGNLSAEEINRVLCPGGVACVRDGDRRIQSTKARPADIDEWNHFLHGPDNNAVARDSVVAAPRSLQWVSAPRWGRSHEELASMSAAVTAGGRVFFIVDQAPLASIRFRGQWSLVARDAFNGTLLWKRDIPTWNDHLRHFRSGPVNLSRRLVAVDRTVYVTLGLGQPVTALDAITGETIRTYAGTEHAEELLVDNDTLYIVAGTSEADRRGGGLFQRDEPEPTDFRHLLAIDARSGETLWKHVCPNNEFLLPLTMTVGQGGVFYQSTYGMVRLDARSGETLWRTERPTLAKRMAFSAPTVVLADGVLLGADRVASTDDPKAETGKAESGKIEWGVHGWSEAGFSRKGKGLLRAYSADSGKELWSVDCSEGYNSPVDLFVVDDTVWVGSSFKGYDLKTGELEREIVSRGARVGMPHHRCYRDKASVGYIFTGRSGIEIVSLADGWQGNNSWIRGTCQYGIMPANGMLYAPPDACACFGKVKQPGFLAVGPRRSPHPMAVLDKTDPSRLEKGPAYSEQTQAPASPVPADCWPMYRHDGTRSGAVTTRLPDALAKKWSSAIGPKLTQPIIVGDTVYVASTDTHTVHALRASDGTKLWSYSTGGRIDSSPTYHNGTLLFGSADGCVYSVRATDGQLVWRFRASPSIQRISSFGQLESIWPVHGSVLVQNDTLYVTAGRSTYLDGGIVLYRLDPNTGRELSHTVVSHLDRKTNQQSGVEPTQSFDMEGTRSDILCGDGNQVFLKHIPFDAEGNETTSQTPHLFAVTGLLGEEWFVRSYWLLGTNVGAGWGGWANMASRVPFGRILCFNDKTAFGYGRTTISSGPVGHRADQYHLFAKDKPLLSPVPVPRRKKAPASPPPRLLWSDEQSLIVRAMALTPDHLIIAGPPDVGRKSPNLLAFENEQEALSTFHGDHGIYLRLISTTTGKPQHQSPLTVPPTFDGLSAAAGRVYISLQDGTVECWGDDQL